MAKKILVIDDEKDIVDIVKEILKNEGYIVETAFDGEEGLRKVVDTKPDLVVVDIMMPKMDGYEFVRRMKEDQSVASIPVIFLTAKDQTTDRYKGLSLGVAAYIVKLFDLDELRETVREVLETKKN
ncbi:MAG: response regulator [Candidatus Margulisiibacteriota bacterium]